MSPIHVAAAEDEEPVENGKSNGTGRAMSGALRVRKTSTAEGITRNYNDLRERVRSVAQVAKRMIVRSENFLSLFPQARAAC